VRAPQRPRLTTPTLEVPQLITSSTPQQALSAAQVSALQQFQSRLWALLNQAWRQPEGLGGLQLSALVNFEVSPSGAIAKVRLSSSSGNASFDASVLAAFRRVGRAGPTPTGRTHQFRMPFRLR
jgi:TonB family protein